MKKTRKINNLLIEINEDKKQLLPLFVLFLLDFVISKIIFTQELDVICATGGVAAAIIGGLSLAHTVYSSERNRSDAQDMAESAEEQRLIDQGKLEEALKDYENIQFENPYKDMENVFEDITVNQQQAQFQAEQGAQQRANILGSLREAAGASGIASLAQAMANQGQIQAQRISADIGKQEAMNQKLIAQGAQAADLAERKGSAMLQQMELDKQSTMLSMQFGQTAGSNQAYQQSLANQMMVQTAGQQAVASSMGNFAGSLMELDLDTSNNNTTTDTTQARLADNSTINTGDFTGIDGDLPVNPSLGDWATINGVLKQYKGNGIWEE